MFWIDLKFAKLAGVSIKLFSVKKDNPFLATGRCPICGDSKKSKTKCRFFFIQQEGDLFAKCHNCGYSGNMCMFLEKFDNSLYTQYVFEKFKSHHNNAPVFDDSPLDLFKISAETIEKIGECYEKNDLFKTLKSVWDLDVDHPARQYIESRRIPKSREVLYCEKFHQFAGNFKEEFNEKKGEHARIIIPFRDRSGKVYAFQGRSLNGEIPKYYTTLIDRTRSKYFNIDHVNPEKLIYVVEGPFDSMFVPNAVAALTSGLMPACIEMQKILNNTPNNYVLVYDNQPRNPEIVKLLSRAIDHNFNVVIWDERYPFKDINEAIENGWKPEDVFRIIKNNTYKGIEALLRFNNWKKC